MDAVIANPDFVELRRQLFASAPAESAAFLAAEPAGERLLVRSFHVFGPDQLEDGGFGSATILEEAQGRELAALKRAGHALIEVHTHPGSRGQVRFSSFDEEELPGFARYVQNKLRGLPFGALVLGEEGYAGRIWRRDGRIEPLLLRAVGQAVDLPTKRAQPDLAYPLSKRFDRQIRALGPAGQARLRALRVAIVGLGGTGSQVVQQLAHLGVRNFVLVEDDRVEESNLPRLAGATWVDAGLRRRKTAIAKRVIRRLTWRARIAVAGPLRSPSSLSELQHVDLIVGCVDNDGARLVLAELAAAHLVPYLDIGVGIEGGDSDVAEIGGRLAFYLPGGPCIACADELDFAEAAEDLESEAARRLRIERGYAQDRRVEPALMPLNTVLVGAAMVELLAFSTGMRPVLPFLRYDASTAELIRQNVELNANCPVCIPAYAMGDRQRILRYALP